MQEQANQQLNYRSGFLSIDIIFSLLILSFAFVLLLQAQKTIIKQLNTRDIENFYEANDNLFHSIKHNVCKKYTLQTSNNHTYNMCMIEGRSKNEVTLRYYTIHEINKTIKHPK
ncbi:hypothetical protein [Helicobacter trogontum]|uniref:Uncharacterized protein n=1 Tax=Helicobacter trogontum TaxID=50960 RepID=A0A4U8T9D8_9HELI|nr:hypothetical protein [Helicobacter trogontum]MDY5185146.1 hypothetical protein [Helicobacter trogontum]TLD96420.1 hypothetical protein LS80_008470 [Helicobacter trogontum]